MATDKLLPILFCYFALAGCAKDTTQWHTLSNSKENGISGIAVIDQSNFFVVHDGKKPEHPRLGIVSFTNNQKPTLKKIDWCESTNLPIDLEAVTAIPNHQNEYLVLESKGKVTRIQLNETDKCKATARFELPTAKPDSNMESLALHCFDNNCVLAWAERGDDKQPAKLSWAKFDISTGTVSTPEDKAFEFASPYPIGNRRSMSDIAVDVDGVLWSSAVSDPGDDGPFRSALYKLGQFSVSDNKIRWTAYKNGDPESKYDTENIKIEGISFVKQGLIMATDDENKGSKIAIKP